MPALFAAASSVLAWLPTAALLWLAFFFGRTLQPGEMALIERICRRSIAAPSARLCRYTRRLTAVWTAYFVLAAALAAMLAASGRHVAIGRFGAAVWGGTIVLFVGEWLVRRVLFPEVDFPNLLQQVRDTWSVWRVRAPRAAEAPPGAEGSAQR